MDYYQKYIKYKNKYIQLKYNIKAIHTENNMNLELIDTTIRRICFNLPLKYTKEQSLLVGANEFKKYEYILYIASQLARLIYCDTGIIWHVIDKSLGMSNDVVNRIIDIYNKKFKQQRSIPIVSQKGEMNLRMESYSLVVAKPDDITPYGTYISTFRDMTCMIIKASKIRNNTNSILVPTDVFITFKGSSTKKNFETDIKSVYKSADLGSMVASIGVIVRGNDNIVVEPFVKELIDGWQSLMKALEEYILVPNTRLFLTGHSLGGAFCTLFGFILAEGKVTNSIPIMKNIKNIHIISFGCPKILSNTARELFNTHLDSSLITLDRVVSQLVPKSSNIIEATQSILSLPTLGISILGPNDIIPSVPLGKEHAGYQPSLDLDYFTAEKKGRVFSIDNIRKSYIPEYNGDRYRNNSTWPFQEDIKFGDKKYNDELDVIINKILGTNEISYKDEESKNIIGGSNYDELNKYHIPNLISHRGNKDAYIIAHCEYLGMFYFDVIRTISMKNPTPKGKIAYFNLYNTGIKINYLIA